MTVAMRQEADFRPQGTSYMRSTVTSAERLEIPEALKGQFVWFGGKGEAVTVRFGDNSVIVDDSTDSSTSGETLSAGGSEPHLHVPSNRWIRCKVDAGFTHLSHISPSTGGKLLLVLATGDGS